VTREIKSQKALRGSMELEGSQQSFEIIKL
jgi:hypothetical protein